MRRRCAGAAARCGVTAGCKCNTVLDKYRGCWWLGIAHLLHMKVSAAADREGQGDACCWVCCWIGRVMCDAGCEGA